MIEQTSRYALKELAADHGFVFDPDPILDQSVFLDMEHYIYRKPIALGIFGAAVRSGDELVCTQYFLENKKDLRHLVLQSLDYLMAKREAGFVNLVAFAARNDLMVLHAMFRKFGLTIDLHDHFRIIDLQKEFQKDFSAMIGLNALEDFAGVRRSGPAISGSTIAKTFASIMADPDYIHRMPAEKRTRLLDYNREDVVNLFFVQANWQRISQDAVQELVRQRTDQREARARQRLQEDAAALADPKGTDQTAEPADNTGSVDPTGPGDPAPAR